MIGEIVTLREMGLILVQVAEKVEDGYRVTVGNVNHHRGGKHLIEWTELTAGKKVCREFLEPA